MAFILALFAAPQALAQSSDQTSSAAATVPTESSASIDAQFVEAALDVCLSAVMARQPLASNADALTHLRPASDATRASHPFGDEPNLWEFAARSDNRIIVRAPDARTCSVFAIDAPPVTSFEALAQALAARGGFSEIENRSRDGRVQRTFRSSDGHVRVELEGFVDGGDVFAGSTGLAMAHIGRR